MGLGEVGAVGSRDRGVGKEWRYLLVFAGGREIKVGEEGRFRSFPSMRGVSCWVIVVADRGGLG